MRCLSHIGAYMQVVAQGADCDNSPRGSEPKSDNAHEIPDKSLPVTPDTASAPDMNQEACGLQGGRVHNQVLVRALP